MSKNNKVVKYKKPLNFNLGMVVFIIIIIYVAFNVFSYFTTSTISEYQVSQGSIMSKNIYHGLILRDETVVNAQQSGYINYYIKNGSRVSVNDCIYSIDTKGEIAQKIGDINSQGDLLSKEALLSISDRIDNFVASYNSNDFTNTYTFKNDLNSQINQLLTQIALDNLSEQINEAQSNHSFTKFKSDAMGVIVYYIDGFENNTVDNFTAGLLDNTGYKKTNLEANTQIESGSPVYKRINSEKWYIVFEISDELATRLQEKSSVRIRFCQDDLTMNVAFEIRQIENKQVMLLTLNSAMIRYANDRYTDVELILDDTTGLKIPKSSITQKEFYTIPKEYFITGNDGSDKGLIVVKNQGEGEENIIVYPIIYYENDSYYYVDSEYVTAGDVIRKGDSVLNDYIVGTHTDSLLGVYNINKGFSVFKQINILYENNEYAIVEPKTSYGIALYDHIALDGSKLEEDQLIKK